MTVLRSTTLRRIPKSKESLLRSLSWVLWRHYARPPPHPQEFLLTTLTKEIYWPTLVLMLNLVDLFKANFC